MTNSPGAPRFSASDFPADSVYGRIQDVIGFKDQRWRFRQIMRLACAVILPILVFAAVTSFEGCFSLGSVFTDGTLNGKDYRLIGMSF